MKRTAWLLLLLGGSALAGSEPINVHGALIPGDAQKVGENRYRTPEDWEGITKTYKRIYPEAQYPRRIIVNQPGVKAIHIALPGSKTTEGINIYQANDEIRIFVVPADQKPAKPKPERKSGKK